MNSRDIEFLYEIGTLRNMPRGWDQHLGSTCADNLAHSFRVAFIALILARSEGVKSDEKILKMALIHDLAETRVSDLSYVQKVYVTADEKRAAHDLFENTSIVDLDGVVLAEYEARQSIEAKIVKDADNLDIDLELKEFEEKGSQLPKKWAWARQKVRDEKLYTDSAKKMWDDIQKSDPADWHMSANKWLKIDKAGK